MNSNIHPFYSHPGKFGVHGPLLAVVAGVAVGYPLGIAYAYLIKWIPFIYLNFLITLGCGFVFGLMTLQLLKYGRVRNGPIALLTGITVGVVAWYFNWNGYIHTLVRHAPLLLTPGQVLAVRQELYKEGSWGIGFSSHTPVTGIVLGIVWLAEAGVIIGISAVISYGLIASTPYCETHECWLNQEKKMDKLDSFSMPAHLEAFRNGDLGPLEEARPRVPASGRFARLTLKHSDQCHDYCALSVANVTVTLDKNGKSEEKVEELMTNVWVPKTMFDYLAQFDRPTAKVTTGI